LARIDLIVSVDAVSTDTSSPLLCSVKERISDASGNGETVGASEIIMAGSSAAVDSVYVAGASVSIELSARENRAPLHSAGGFLSA
jgi:hypothetical protein